MIGSTFACLDCLIWQPAVPPHRLHQVRPHSKRKRVRDDNIFIVPVNFFLLLHMSYMCHKVERCLARQPAHRSQSTNQCIIMILSNSQNQKSPSSPSIIHHGDLLDDLVDDIFADIFADIFDNSTKPSPAHIVESTRIETFSPRIM